MNNPAAEYASRRHRNLEFFKRYYPEIYNHFSDYRMSRYQMNILTETHEVDLIGPEGAVYQNAASAYADREVSSFRSIFSKRKRLSTLLPITSAGFFQPRFMHRHLKALVDPYQENLDKSGYVIEFYPLVVFMGIGLGLQIEKLCREETIQHMIFAEPDPDRFAASLYVVEWEDVCKEALRKPGRSARFIIGLTGNINDIYADIWNSLIMLCPVYPAGTSFFVHQGDPEYGRVVDKLNDNMMVYLNSWGNYDDEIRQLNNALHTFHQKIPLLPPQINDPGELPVFILGNGPSLDQRIESIREFRGKAIIITCGTALRSLLAYGVEPDIHVELESDYVSHRVLAETDHEKLSRLRIIAVTHVCPLHFSLFGQSRVYFKRENVVAEFFGEGKPVFEMGVPTCVNAALSIVINLGFKNVFLFGTDFGYRDRRYHHSKESIYQAGDKGELEEVVKFTPTDEINVEGWQGETLLTKPIYYSTLRMVERLLNEVSQTGRSINCYTCADGARIEHTQWLSKDDVREKFAGQVLSDKNRVLEEIFSPDSMTVDLDVIDEKLAYSSRILRDACRELKKVVESSQLDGKLWSMAICCSRINQFIEMDIHKQSQGLYYLIRGTIRCWTYVGLTYAWAITQADRRSVFTQDWRERLIAMLDALPGHYERITRKDFDINLDPWVRQGIQDPESPM